MKKILFLFLMAGILFMSCDTDSDDFIQNDSSYVDSEFSTKRSKKNSKHYMSGQELFQSIFFGAGRYAENLSHLEPLREQLSALSDEDRDGYLNQISQFTEMMSERNPDFFDRFKRGITSSNNVEVENAMHMASELVLENASYLLPEFESFENRLVEDIETGAMVNDDGSLNNRALQENVDDYVSNVHLLEENFIANGGNGDICFVFVAAIYFVVALHNTAAVTLNVAAVAVAAVYAAVYASVETWGPALDEPAEGGPIFNGGSGELMAEMLIRDIVRSN